MFEVGTTFKHTHAAGVTEYRLHSPHRDFGYWNCVSVSEPEIHKALRGSFQTFHRDAILKALGCDEKIRYWENKDLINTDERKICSESKIRAGGFTPQ